MLYMLHHTLQNVSSVICEIVFLCMQMMRKSFVIVLISLLQAPTL